MQVVYRSINTNCCFVHAQRKTVGKCFGRGNCSVDGVLLDWETEPGHDGRANAAWYRQRHQPRYDDVAEDGPVDVLPRSESSDEHHRPDLAVGRADGYADVRGNQHRQRRADLDTETTETNHVSRRFLQHSTATQAGWFLRPDCAPSSERPQFSNLWSESVEWCGRNISGSAHLCRRLLLHAGAVSAQHSIGGRLPEWQTSKCISSVSFLRIESIFFTIHRRHRCKKWWTRILKFEFCDFWEFFWNFQKGVARSLCGRSGPLWSRPN